MKILYNNIAERDKTLPFYFHSACSCHSQESISRPHGSPLFHQILLVVDGTGVLRCRGNTYELKRGCAFFIAMGEPAEYISTGGLITAFLTVRGSAVGDLLTHYDCDGFLFFESINPEKYVCAIDRLIDAYFEHKRQGILSAMAYAFYTDFFEHRHNTVTYIEEIALYIEKSFMTKLTLDQLAGIGCVSVSKLCHDFKINFGVSVFQYILDLRLTYASTLLLSDPDTTTKEAAVSSGFEDVSYFCRAYKKKFGKSPSEDRKRGICL